MPPLTFRDWREKLGLTQAQAAAALDMTRRQVQYYESELSPQHRGVQVPALTVRYAMAYLEEHPELIPRSS